GAVMSETSTSYAPVSDSGTLLVTPLASLTVTLPTSGRPAAAVPEMCALTGAAGVPPAPPPPPHPATVSMAAPANASASFPGLIVISSSKKFERSARIALRNSPGTHWAEGCDKLHPINMGHCGTAATLIANSPVYGRRCGWWFGRPALMLARCYRFKPVRGQEDAGVACIDC